jgi:hypothetical protein
MTSPRHGGVLTTRPETAPIAWPPSVFPSPSGPRRMGTSPATGRAANSAAVIACPGRYTSHADGDRPAFSRTVTAERCSGWQRHYQPEGSL